MSAGPLTPQARRENVRALALAAGLSEEEASVRLEQVVLVTYDAGDIAARQLAAASIPVLSRTVSTTIEQGDAASSVAAELVIGAARPRTSGPHVYATLHPDRCLIGHSPKNQPREATVHPLPTLIAACYVAGAAIRSAVGEGIPNLPPDDLEIAFDAFIDRTVDLDAPVDLGDAHLAGAGAIGNGFLWAARHVSLRGRLHVADDDIVSPGNLQRQIWFDEEDINKPKATQLCLKARPHLPNCELIPALCRLQDHPDRGEGAWLRRLIVAVDSRRARRHLQNELPGEVFDASTTGSQEIVLHYNRQPTDLACMGCIYPRDEREVTHEQAVAAHLGIEVEAVRSERIDAATARQICETHTHLHPDQIEGLAFDTLYKELCGSGRLRAVSEKQVIAPFAFVSVLAGATLLLEVMRRQHGRTADRSNDWRINPWWPPVPELRQTRRRRPGCECCSRPAIQRAIASLWGDLATV